MCCWRRAGSWMMSATRWRSNPPLRIDGTIRSPASRATSDRLRRLDAAVDAAIARQRVPEEVDLVEDVGVLLQCLLFQKAGDRRPDGDIEARLTA